MPIPDLSAPQVAAALIAAAVAAFASIASIILQIVFRVMDKNDEKKQSIHEKRQEALLLALQVIDHVYANTYFNNREASNPHEWDISLAHDAMNKMILYCINPSRAIEVFSNAIGLHNPDTQMPIQYGPRHLDEFRKVVCNELNLPTTNHVNQDIVWIFELPGSKRKKIT
jgi:hypothetical protein